MVNVTVTVLVDGTYGVMDGAKMRAQPARAGDVIEVAGGWYVDSLTADGLVVVCAQTVEDPVASVEPDAAAPQRKPASRGKRAEAGEA